jgi:regulatory protein
MGDQAPFDRAVRLLAARPRSTAEIQARLEQSGASPSEVGSAIERLVQLGYLDDRALARTQAELLVREGRMSLRAAQTKLTARGIDAPIAEEAVGALQLQDRALAHAALEKRFGPGPLRPADEARAFRFLAQRGFDPELVAELVADPIGRTHPD